MKRVQLPDGATAEFPDEMPDASIEAVLRRQFTAPPSASSPFLQPPQGETTLRAPTFWERSRMQGSGLLEKIGMNPESAKATSEFAIPGTTTEAGVQGALALTPGVGPVLSKVAPGLAKTSPFLMRTLTRAGRVALPTAAGAVAGGVSGEGALGGAGKGAAVSATGEVLATPLQWMTRSLASPIMQRLDSQRLSKVANEVNSSLPLVKTPAELHRLMVGTTGDELIGQALERDLQPVLAATKGREFRFPVIDTLKGQPTPVSFEGALDQLRKIGRRGWSGGDPRGAMTSAEARELRYELRQQMVDALNNPSKYLSESSRSPSSFPFPSGKAQIVPPQTIISGSSRPIAQRSQPTFPGMAKQFDDAMQKYARGREVIDVLSDPKVWEGGRLNMRALQETVGSEEYKSIGRALKQDAERFYNAVYRGGTALTRDVQGSAPLHIRMYPGAGVPHFGIGLPRVPAYGGPNAPALARKGASLAPVTSFTTLGLFGRGSSDERGE